MFDPPQLLHYFIDFNEFYIKFVAFEMLYWIEVAKILSQKILSNFLGPKVKGVPKFGILRVQTDGLCLWVTKTDWFWPSYTNSATFSGCSGNQLI